MPPAHHLARRVVGALFVVSGIAAILFLSGSVSGVGEEFQFPWELLRDKGESAALALLLGNLVLLATGSALLLLPPRRTVWWASFVGVVGTISWEFMAIEPAWPLRVPTLVGHIALLAALTALAGWRWRS